MEFTFSGFRDVPTRYLGHGLHHFGLFLPQRHEGTKKISNISIIRGGVFVGAGFIPDQTAARRVSTCSR